WEGPGRADGGPGYRRRGHPVHRHHPGAGDAVPAGGGRGAAAACRTGRLRHLAARHGEDAMKLVPTNRRTLALLGLLLPLLVLFIYVLLRTGPMAAVPVTVSQVQTVPLSPALFGIGTVEARHTHRIGPTVAARVLRVEVDVGDRVRAGQLLAE